MSNRPDRYTRKQQHKQALKRRHAIHVRLYCAELDEAECRREYEEALRMFRLPEDRNRGYEYWKQFYRSGYRKFAKESTNRCIRNRFRMKKDSMDPPEIAAMRHSDYQKEFDYWWTIW